MSEQLDGTGTSVGRATQGLGIDDPLAAYQAGKWYMYQADGLGSIVTFVSPDDGGSYLGRRCVCPGFTNLLSSR